MENIFTRTQLVESLPLLLKSPYKEELQSWELKKTARLLRRTYDITSVQANKLASMDLTHEKLQELYGNRVSDAGFDRVLHNEKGISGKDLRGKVLEWMRGNKV